MEDLARFLAMEVQGDGHRGIGGDSSKGDPAGQLAGFLYDHQPAT